jgi:hypothetical protein
MHPILHVPTSSSRLNGQRNEPVNTSMHLDRLDLEDEIDHPLLQSEESEIPFTYLAYLKARKELEPVVQGRIQVCILFLGLNMFTSLFWLVSNHVSVSPRVKRQFQLSSLSFFLMFDL